MSLLRLRKFFQLNGLTRGPTEQIVTYAQQMQVSLGGYGTTFLTLQ